MVPKDNHRRNKLDSIHPFGVFVGVVPRTGWFVVLTLKAQWQCAQSTGSLKFKSGTQNSQAGSKVHRGISRPMPETTLMVVVFHKEQMLADWTRRLKVRPASM